MPADRNARGAGEGKSTTFVNLSRYPLNTDEARAIAAAIRDGSFAAIGRATEWPAEQVEAGDWSPIQWYYGELATGIDSSAQEREAPNGGIAVPIQRARAQRLALLRADRGQSSNARPARDSHVNTGRRAEIP